MESPNTLTGTGPAPPAGLPHLIVIAFGANLGDPMDTFGQVIEALKGEPGKFKIRAVSNVWRTIPHGPVTEQPLFLNGALMGHTCLAPLEVLAWTQALENRLGRRRTLRWGPRTIDLDLLFYDGIIFSSPGKLEIPHPRIEERDFVLLPLMEICPNHPNPATGNTVREAARNLGVIMEMENGTWQPATGTGPVGKLRL